MRGLLDSFDSSSSLLLSMERLFLLLFLFFLSLFAGLGFVATNTSFGSSLFTGGYWGSAFYFIFSLRAFGDECNSPLELPMLNGTNGFICLEFGVGRFYFGKRQQPLYISMF